MNAKRSEETKLLAETQYLRFVETNGWTYVERAAGHQVVCVIACTPEDRLILVEQYRPPVGTNVIEMPAGLCGDLQEELLETAAHRELLEETGYQAKQLHQSVVVVSSAGLTSEVVTLFLAEGLEKVAAGGGDESEAITVHEVPMDRVDAWLAEAAALGKRIDARVYSGLYLLRQFHASK